MITNPSAGGAAGDALESGLAVLREYTSVEVASTEHPGELDGVLHRAGSRLIVVAGGDGSMHAVVAALHRRNELAGRVLGLLPLGTGNDFARGAGLPLDIEDAARVIAKGGARPVDLLVDEVGEIVVNSVHVGVGAEAGKEGARWKPRLGRAGYAVGAVIAAVRPKMLRLRVEVDGEVVNDIDQPVLMVAIGNGSQVGGGLQLTPDADPGDGLADVMISRAVTPLARAAYAVRLGRGSHGEHDEVTTVRGSVVSVTGGDFWCSADGEVYGPERRRTWRVEHAAYNLLR